MVSPSSRMLDALRGVAALLVVFGHSRQYVAGAADLDPAGTGLTRILLAPAGVSMESVAVFFVLSGYLVGGQVVRQGRADTFAWSTYLTKRLSRLWTVLLPGLLITWAVIAAGRNLIPPALRQVWGADDDSWADAACNAVFLQKSRCGTYSVNEALWSLSYEFWFYVVFAAAVAALFAVRRRRHAVAGANLLVLVGALTLFGPHLLLLMPAWLFGVVVAVAVEDGRFGPVRRPGRFFAGTLMLLAMTMAAATVLELPRAPLMLLVGVPATLVVFGATQLVSEPPVARDLVSAGAALGKISFSVYVFHIPFIVIGAVLAERAGWVSRFGLPVTTYALALATLPLMWALWWLTERHTTRVRDLFLRRTPRSVESSRR